VADRESFAVALNDLVIVDRVFRSGANFVLVTLALAVEAARELADQLLEKDGLYVKDVSSKFNDGRVYWRLAVRTPGDNNRFCAALRCRSIGVGAPYGHG
jgi:histidinol-phosphate/aromatic aminotransferase/cobyric acid decarboxylase-like protein